MAAAWDDNVAEAPTEGLAPPSHAPPSDWAQDVRTPDPFNDRPSRQSPGPRDVLEYAYACVRARVVMNVGRRARTAPHTTQILNSWQQAVSVLHVACEVAQTSAYNVLTGLVPGYDQWYRN